MILVRVVMVLFYVYIMCSRADETGEDSYFVSDPVGKKAFDRCSGLLFVVTLFPLLSIYAGPKHARLLVYRQPLVLWCG